MCGIAGIYNFNSNAPVQPAVVEQMTRTLSHRGPDAEGFHFDGPLGFGHRRLSILDLSERGRQPMFFQNGRYSIVFNGEIYNYVELREELIAKGHTFRTDTDTEVLLALFAEKGIESLSRLNGMFAFAVWDAAQKSLFLVRDRMGIKPLYYANTTQGLVFASEIKALLVSGQVSPEVDARLIDNYFTFGYVVGSDTLFKGCKRLPPGHWMSVTADGVKSGSYWNLQFKPNAHRTAEDTATELRELLLDAVKIHLRSDVPIGVFLSGGLDSSTMVALAAEAGVEDLKTFSVAYDEGSEFDETPYARMVADRYHTDHRVLYVDPAQFRDSIPSYVWYMDEPVTEAPAISLYFIAKHLRQYVTVALSGEGSDELFGGYDGYQRMQRFELYRRLPETLRSGLESLTGLTGNAKLRRYALQARQPLEQRYKGVSIQDASYKDLLYSNEFRSLLGRGDDPLAAYYAQTRGYDTLSRMLYNDLRTWLVDDLLIKADRMTMANSVELRVPFLDYRVVDFAATIPSHMKIRKGQSKWILKQAIHDRLPEQILSRKKLGFPAPLSLMFQNELSGYIRDVLLSERCTSRSYFKRDAVEQLIDEHIGKKKDHHIVLWKLIVLEEWHRQFMDVKVSAAC
jgi:asparagine synthase (glutamine-hydrolysing)